jgi:[ribulose-bisphosphate carboxylase]-lysine N-methyltransferase
MKFREKRQILCYKITMSTMAAALMLLLTARETSAFSIVQQQRCYRPPSSSRVLLTKALSVDSMSESLEQALDACRSDVVKTCKVKVAPSESTGGRLGLVATTDIKEGDVVLSMPYDDRYILSSDLARSVFKNVLPDGYDGWTGDSGLIGLLLLNEVARLAGSGIDSPQRPEPIQKFVQAWLESLPSPSELTTSHPYYWSEDDQEILQMSSTTKIYQKLDDIDEDAAWLEERVWNKDRAKFPETVTLGCDTIPCFTAEGFKWAMALAVSRSVFVDGALRLLPVFDMANHNDKGREISGGTMGAFGTTKGAQLVAGKSYKAGDEVFCSYGPKSAADYLLEHGFCPPQVFKTSVSELTFELDPEDRFYDDKLDVLEFETYELAPMDPVQSFDIVSAPGQDSSPDPAMIQFLRLSKLGAQDAFLLESIFRKDVWGFMALPVSEKNEEEAVDTIIGACQKALDEMEQCEEGGPEVCNQLRESEKKALTRTMEYLQREKEALDLKEYYQERRLKDLGLDSEWSPEDDVPDLGYGQTRAPGGADYDW